MKRFSISIVLTAILAMIMMQIIVCPQLCKAESGSSIVALYDAMVEQFDKDKNMAYEISNDLEIEGGQSYSDATRYINYLKGWKAMEDGDIDSAVRYFAPIAEIDFKDAKGYLSYLNGRKAQESGEYKKAIDYYNEAASLNVTNGDDYLAECLEMWQEQQYATAERYAAQKNYKMAAQKFEELGTYKDSNARKKECYYKYAAQLIEKLEFEEAVEIYNSLGSYEDNEALAEKYSMLAQGDFLSNAITNLTVKAVDPQTLIVEWADDLKLGDFTVTWYPGAMQSLAEQKRVDTTQVQLEGLIPSTNYHITVSSTVYPAASAEKTGMTKRASEKDDNADGKESKITVLAGGSIYKYSLEDRGNMSLVQIQNTKSTVKVSEIMLPAYSMSESGDGYMFSCSIGRDTTSDDESYDFICVLQIGEEYMAASSGTVTVAGSLKFPALYFDLTPLFDQIYDNSNSWPGSIASIDLYINGSPLTRNSITLTEEQ